MQPQKGKAPWRKMKRSKYRTGIICCVASASLCNFRSPSKSKKTKSFKFTSKSKEKREKSREKDKDVGDKKKDKDKKIEKKMEKERQKADKKEKKTKHEECADIAGNKNYYACILSTKFIFCFIWSLCQI